MYLAKLLIIFLYITLLNACSNQLTNNLYDSSKEHHGDGKFISQIQGSLFSWLKMRYDEGSFPEVSDIDKQSIQTKTDLTLIHSSSESPRVTWVGHATMLIQYQGINFLTDPHFSPTAAPIEYFVDDRLTSAALEIQQLPKIDFVVISHNHYDHLDHRTVDKLSNSVTWYVPLGLKQWFINRGIDHQKVIELDWWQSHSYKPNVKITFTPTVHWSKRTPFNTNQSLWGSWGVKIDNFNTWFAGDTAYDSKMFKQIGQRVGPFQLGIIPIGAYSPRHFMKSQHINPSEAVKMHQDIQAEISVPMHWGTFQLTSEPFLEPPKLLKSVLKDKNILNSKFPIMNIGETKIIIK